MKKNKFLIESLVCLALFDIIDVTSFFDFLNINYEFWSSLLTPLIIFYLGLNTFNQYQKDRNSKKDKLYANILDMKVLAIIELSTSIYTSFQISPLPKRLIESMNEATPFYVIEFKKLEQEVVNALSNCEKYDSTTFENINDSRSLLGVSAIQDDFSLNNKYDVLHSKLLEQEKIIKKRLSSMQKNKI